VKVTLLNKAVLSIVELHIGVIFDESNGKIVGIFVGDAVGL